MTTALSTPTLPIDDRATDLSTDDRSGLERPSTQRPPTQRSATVRSATVRSATERPAAAAPVIRTAPHPQPSRRRTHLAAVPDCEPPFDDERPGFGPVSTAAARWTWSRSVGVPVVDWTVPSWCNDTDMGVERTARSALPDPRETAGVLARAVIEALAGLRQLNQLSTHCSPEVFAALKVRVRTGGAPPKLMSVRASEPTDGIAEASAVFRRGARAAALAFRLQGIDGRWRVTALQIG